ncbi:hypothetical protein HY628_01010 [Candidatus Uhrbacteria bacterium]|nr:hypothetical protein [Candidatus Uhrbacteria bacterium]
MARAVVIACEDARGVTEKLRLKKGVDAKPVRQSDSTFYYGVQVPVADFGLLLIELKLNLGDVRLQQTLPGGIELWVRRKKSKSIEDELQELFEDGGLEIASVGPESSAPLPRTKAKGRRDQSEVLLGKTDPALARKAYVAATALRWQEKVKNDLEATVNDFGQCLLVCANQLLVKREFGARLKLLGLDRQELARFVKSELGRLKEAEIEAWTEPGKLCFAFETSGGRVEVRCKAADPPLIILAKSKKSELVVLPEILSAVVGFLSRWQFTDALVLLRDHLRGEG